MPTRPRRPARPKRAAARPKTPAAQTLQRRLVRMAATYAAELQKQTRRLAALRRAHDRRVAGLVQEIAQLRHHEARTEALTRLLAERDVALAAQAARIAELESLLQGRTELR